MTDSWYTVVVKSGKGGGDYAQGATVTIKANAPASGKRFKTWTTEDGVKFANATASGTTFVMPAKNVTVTATYEDNKSQPAAKTSIKASKVTGVKAKTWTGKARTQSLTVKLSGKTLKRGTDYTVTYKNNKNVGKATVTIKGKGKYTGTITKKFKINPKGTSLKKLKGAKKAIKVEEAICEDVEVTHHRL